VIAKVIWSAAACWTLLAILSVTYFLIHWLSEPGNPLRHEYGIGVATALVYASPAGAALMLLALPPHSYIPGKMKLAGLGLVTLLAAVTTIFYSLAS
jgi:hypothetical protein